MNDDYPVLGLSPQEVEDRKAQGLANGKPKGVSRSALRIISDNTLTLFNLINLTLAVALLAVGSYKNVLFIFIALANLLIGIIQELRAKRAVDKLSVFSASEAGVVRGGELLHIPPEDIVRDDLLELVPGQQIPVDCRVLSGTLECDESCVTGESDGVRKAVGDLLYSGSFVAGGKCRAAAVSVGKDTYISSLAAAVKLSRPSSEIMRTLQKIIRILSFIVLPVGILLFVRQYFSSGSIADTVTSTAAALLGMVPNGLMLLTSTVFAVSIIRLTQNRVLVKELYSIENLARVDTLCLDKTGTLTQGHMEVCGIELLSGTEDAARHAAAGLCSVLPDNNPTFLALSAYFGTCDATASAVHPFTSKTKWSGAVFADGAYVWGAPEYVCPDMSKELAARVNAAAAENRVLLFAAADDLPEDGAPVNAVPVMLILIKDILRPDVIDTVKYFYRQDVDIFVFSGDNQSTVTRVAADCGIAGSAADASVLKPDDYAAALKEHRLFARVSPLQKQDFVRCLKAQGRVVAMTGDGVNDVPALRESDCSVAMGSGTDAARNISQLVLLDCRFSALPEVIAEGRRSINNLQRSSALFLVKTIYAALLSILFIFVSMSYPFDPIQLSLLSVTGIGVPSFLLALEPNHDRVKGKFFDNILRRCLPGGLTVFINIALLHLLAPALNIPEELLSSFCVLISGLMFMINLYFVSKPLNLYRGAIFIAMLLLLCLGIFVFGGFFSIILPTGALLLPLAGFAVFTVLLFLLLRWLAQLIFKA